MGKAAPFTPLNSPFDYIALRLYERPESKGERDVSWVLALHERRERGFQLLLAALEIAQARFLGRAGLRIGRSGQTIRIVLLAERRLLPADPLHLLQLIVAGRRTHRAAAAQTGASPELENER